MKTEKEIYEEMVYLTGITAMMSLDRQFLYNPERHRLLYLSLKLNLHGRYRLILIKLFGRSFKKGVKNG